MAFRWVIENELVRGSRPRNGKKWARQVPKPIVDKWITTAKTTYGIRSVICLLDQKHLHLYEQLHLDLVSYFRRKGFNVVHIPVRLQPHLVLSKSQLKRIWRAYNELPKPVLVHCSAGIGRTGKAVTHIMRKLKENPSGAMQTIKVRQLNRALEVRALERYGKD